jgi:very-short-patch-repair endonuclease/predicted transcriptional regulator of viral defense system
MERREQADKRRCRRGRPLSADLDARLGDLASAHHGALLLRDIRALGVSRGALARRVRSGSMRRAARGVYVLVAARDMWTSLAVAQLRWPGAVACGTTAAALWGLDAFDRPDPAGLARPQVMMRSARSGAPPGVHRTRFLHDSDVCVRHGLRVTSVVRTLGDLAQQAEPDDGADEVERALESALRRGLTTVAALEARLAGKIGRGRSVLAKVLEVRGQGTPATDSDPETRLVQLIRRYGLPSGVRQFELWHEDRFVARPDLFYPTELLAVEVDGSETHATPAALQADLDRQNRMTLVGIVLLRFTYQDVTRRPRTVAGRLAAALRMRALAEDGASLAST